MALTPQEELELKQLEAEQEELMAQFNSIKEQLAPKKKPETSMLEAGARGFAQGLTFDTADEIAAGFESAVTGKSYDQALEESRAEYKAAEEQYPTTSMLGGLAGGITQGLGLAALTGGASAPASAVGAASKLGKIGQLAKTALLPTAGKSAAANIGSAALSGATYGALSEIGQSEKEGLERLEEVPTALVTGGIVGGGLGATAEAAKKAGSSVSKFISKKIDEGKVPFSLRKIRDLWREGKKGQGFITEESTKAIDDKVEKASRDTINTIQNSLDEGRQIKKGILNKVNKPIHVKSTLETIQSKLQGLAAEGITDADKALKRITGILDTVPTDEFGNVTPRIADDIINKLDDYIVDRANNEVSSGIKNIFKDSVNELKYNLRISINEKDIQNSLLKDTPLYNRYKKYVQRTSSDLLENSDILTDEEKKLFAILGKEIKKKTTSPEAMEKKVEKYLREKNKFARGRPSKAKKQESLTKDIEILEGLKKPLQQEAKIISPLGRLDSTMHNILNASETLGGITRGNKLELDRVFKIYDILRRSSAETGTGKKALIRYNEAMEQLKKADKKLGERVQSIMDPTINLIESERFVQGAKLGEGAKDVSALSQLVTAPAVMAGTAGNVLAQLAESKAGSTIVRPTLSFLKNRKKTLDDALSVDPNNKLLKALSKGLDDAINSADETRRAAILNTLMQYESIRKLFKEE